MFPVGIGFLASIAIIAGPRIASSYALHWLQRFITAYEHTNAGHAFCSTQAQAFAQNMQALASRSIGSYQQEAAVLAVVVGWVVHRCLQRTIAKPSKPSSLLEDLLLVLLLCATVTINFMLFPSFDLNHLRSASVQLWANECQIPEQAYVQFRRALSTSHLFNILSVCMIIGLPSFITALGVACFRSTPVSSFSFFARPPSRSENDRNAQPLPVPGQT
jgi:hypothetical protein